MLYFESFEEKKIIIRITIDEEWIFFTLLAQKYVTFFQYFSGASYFVIVSFARVFFLKKLFNHC